MNATEAIRATPPCALARDGASPTLASTVLGAFARARRRLARARRVRRDTEALLRSSDHLLRDIGLTRIDAASAWGEPARLRTTRIGCARRPRS